jgi:Mg-chelatase subunit ChlD
VAGTCPRLHPWIVYLPRVVNPLCTPSGHPADIAIMLDRSGSMGHEGLAATRRHVAGLVQDLDLEHYRVALLAFDQRVEVLAGLGSDRRRIEQGLTGLALAPGTRLERAIRSGAAALGGVRGAPGRRRLLIMITDGVQTGPGGQEAVLRAAATARAQGLELLVIAIGPAPGRRLLEGVAGRPRNLIEARTPDDMAGAFRELMATLQCAGEPGAASGPPASTE